MDQEVAAAAILVKVERAKEHLLSLESLVLEYLQGEPYRVICEDDTATGDVLFRVQVLRQPPLKWAAIVGDVIHNLRAALDLLVCELVRREGGVVRTQTQFPIAKSAAEFDDQIEKRRCLQGVTKDVEQQVRALKPYQGGNDLLWWLHRLDISDKHKLLLTVGSAHHSVIIDLFQDTKKYLDSVFPGFYDSMPMVTNPSDKQWPLKDGAVIYRASRAALEAGVTTSPEFTFEIAFGSDEVGGKPLIETLQQFIALVEGIVCQFLPAEGDCSTSG